MFRVKWKRDIKKNVNEQVDKQGVSADDVDYYYYLKKNIHTYIYMYTGDSTGAGWLVNRCLASA